MGRICPILNHPLNDGVLIDDEAIVKFIQKRNLDFLPNELVCRSCKHEVTKLYNKKIKKAKELYKSRLHDGSVSSLKTSKSSSASATSERSTSHNASLQSVQHGTHNGTSRSKNTLLHVLNCSKTNYTVQDSPSANSSKIINIPTNILSVSETSIVVSTNSGNIHPLVLQEKDNNQTKLKKTIPEFFRYQPNANITARNSKTINVSSKQIRHQTADDEGDVIRRLSQEPTTSRAENTNKRRILAVVESDEDDDRVSLNAVNGTLLPNIQPIPPKRKPKVGNRNSLAQDIMDEYIKDITGG